MSLDCSRFTFNAWHDFLGVVMQQGRVQLDSDWNEGVAQLVRRVQAGALDTFEKTVVPRSTPDGFRIAAAGGALTIGVGRIYVDGILAENHGGGAIGWDARLAEPVGAAALAYTAQPYYPQPPALPASGRHLAYLDVWQREVTPLQAPDLVEKAIGVDTTGRWQTVWQVKLLEDIGTAGCATPDAGVPGWQAATRPSGARLTTDTALVAGSPDPCLVPPTGGYLGLENQLYRIEIHRGGAAAAQATFKWSRDNGSVATTVRTIDAARTRLTVDSIGRDAVLRFSDGDWVEISDDVLELHGEPGLIRRILPGGGVDDATRSIVLSSPLPAGVFPTGAQDATEPARHTRIRRWDQSGRVLRADGTLFHDLDAASATGEIPVPPAGVQVTIEDGIVVSFALDGAGGFRAGDHWAIAARAADASIERLDRAPPRGIHHHYARLAVVEFPGSETDCRVFWPPAANVGEDCACDACVTPEGHAQGSATIQQAIDRLAPTGGVICLAAGRYRLREPLRIEGAGSLTLRGKGWRTVLIPEGTGSAIAVERSVSVRLEQFAVAGAAGTGDGRALVASRNNVALELDHLYLLALSHAQADSIGVQLAGYALGFTMRQCAVLAGIGVGAGLGKDKDKDKEDGLMAAALDLSDNLFVCNRHGVALGRRTLLFGHNGFSRNLVLGCRATGLSAIGATLPGGSLTITGNAVSVTGDAIVAGVDTLRVVDNDIRGADAKESGHGIVLCTGLDPKGIDAAWISGNRIGDLAGHAVDVRGPVGSASIGGNLIERARAAIVLAQDAACRRLSITGNDLRDIAIQSNTEGESLSAIQVLGSAAVDISGNHLEGFARQAVQARDRVAIRILAGDDVSVCANRMTELGPTGEYAGYAAAIELQGPYARARVSDNTITRSTSTGVAPARWQAIRIGARSERGVYAFGAVLVEAKEALLLTASSLRQFALRQPESVIAGGNQLSAGALAAHIVEVQGPASCLFTGNHVEATIAGGSFKDALVTLGAFTVAAANNRLRWVDSDLTALNIVDAKAFTVLGNITAGDIRIGNAGLADPWKPLNIIA